MSKAIELTVLQRVQSEMERHLLAYDAPVEVWDFLHGHWARLLTGIYVSKGNQDADWLAGWDTVNALLWSLAPKTSRSETERMLHLLPVVLERLHEGCAVMSLAARERDALFEKLAMMHAAVARAGLRCRDKDETGVTRLAQRAESVTSQELAELRPTQPAQAVESAADATSVAIPELSIGDRVHFLGQGQTRTLSLNWISPARGMYLFGNEQAMEAMTLTRARLAQRFQQGQAVLVTNRA